METISAFIDGGGSVLVAASSDIGESGPGGCGISQCFSRGLRALHMEAAKWAFAVGRWGEPCQGGRALQHPSVPPAPPVTRAREVRSRSCFRAGTPVFLFLRFAFSFCSFVFLAALKKEGKREDEQIFVSYFGHFQRHLEAGRGEWDPEPLVLNHQLH